MEPARPKDGVRKRLAAIIAEDRPDTAVLVAHLRELRDREQLRSFSIVLHLLAHLNVPERQAEQIILDLLRHRDDVTRALGRDPGIRVAAIDYLSNVKKLLVNPTIVEHSQLERTERSAMTDGLTGLYNRRYFLSALGLELKRSRRYSLRLSVLMLDLDSFKLLNDRHGHLFGDLVLQRVARGLKRAVRDPDVACRFGGEEFAVMLPETDRMGAYAVAERVRQRIQQRFAEKPVASKRIRLTLSGGIGSYPVDGTEAAALLASADQALYLAKETGKNRISLYHSERRAHIRYPAKLGSRVTVSRGRQVEVGRGRLIDISVGGALVELPESLSEASRVEFRFDARGGDDPSPVRGRIARVASERPGACRVAVVFDRKLDEQCLSNQVRRRAWLSAAGGRY